MTQEEKYKEALLEARALLEPCLKYSNGKVREALDSIDKELKSFESEDERIMKTIRQLLETARDAHSNTSLAQPYIDALAWLEKQKDASKAIEAVERVDKYIDEHLANAHDMKDSNPDKKYYRGWDDALGAMAGILQDVYSGEKQKEQKPASISCGHENDKLAEWSEEDKEKIVTISEIIEHCTTIPYSGGTLTLNKEYKKELLCFIKSLRPQYHGDVTMTEAYKMGLEAGRAQEGAEKFFDSAQSYHEGFVAGQKQKENPKSADSIPSDCASDAKCEDRWHKVADSLPDNPREVLCKDEAGNYFIGRYYVGEGWDISNYDDEDKPHHLNPPVSKWIDFPSENQKEQKPWKVGANAYFTPEQKPAEWSEEDELMQTTVIQTLERFGGCGTTRMQIDWLKSLSERFSYQTK